MARRSKHQEPVIYTGVEVLDIAEEGKGIGKVDDLVIFIEKAIPGDVVDIQLLRKKKNFAEAKIIALQQPSPHRVGAFCAHFGTCGGCKWQHMTYEAQLIYKEQTVRNALERLGKVDASSMEPILPSAATTYYRNKLEYTFSNKRWLDQIDMSETPQSMNALGFHVPGRFDKILEVQHCYLQADPSNQLRNELFAFVEANNIRFYDLRAHEGALRNLIIRTTSTGQVMVVVVFAYATDVEIELVMGFLKQRFPELNSLLYIVNHKLNDTIFDQDIHVYSGLDYILEEMDGLSFKIGAKSFYQTNSQQAFELYKITRDFAGFEGHERVYDLYTGAGTIANFVAREVKEVIGIEYVPTAIADAVLNSKMNNIENTSFYAGDMKEILTTEFINEHGRPDVVITDPPRAGMHADVVQKLIEMAAPKVVYVSCNAATQARDLLLLKEHYDVVRIRPVDMFPHTQHVENVVLLALKS